MCPNVHVALVHAYALSAKNSPAEYIRRTMYVCIYIYIPLSLTSRKLSNGRIHDDDDDDDDVENEREPTNRKADSGVKRARGAQENEPPGKRKNQ